MQDAFSYLAIKTTLIKRISFAKAIHDNWSKFMREACETKTMYLVQDLNKYHV